jgi:hypothetical protein
MFWIKTVKVLAVDWFAELEKLGITEREVGR